MSQGNSECGRKEQCKIVFFVFHVYAYFGELRTTSWTITVILKMRYEPELMYTPKLEQINTFMPYHANKHTHTYIQLRMHTHLYTPTHPFRFALTLMLTQEGWKKILFILTYSRCDSCFQKMNAFQKYLKVYSFETRVLFIFYIS